MKTKNKIIQLVSQLAKNLFYTCTVFAFFLLASCTNPKEHSEIIQHPEVLKTPLDGAAKQVVLKANIKIQKDTTEKIAKLGKSTQKRRINKAPIKTLEELKMEIAFLEEQGSDKESAASLYNEYGDALYESKQYDEAIDAYQEAEDYGYKDLKTLCYKIAKSYAINGQYYGSMEDYLFKAKDNGFRNYEALMNDTAFDAWRADYEFLYLYKELFGKNKKAMFKAFVTMGPKNNLTKDYKIDPISLFENTEYSHRKKQGFYEKHPIINGHFEDFVQGVSESMFSRGGGDHFRYELVLTNNKNYVAVIYSEEEEWSDYILPKKYQLVTFDKGGNKISELEIAKRGSMSKCKGLVFRADHTIEVSNYQVDWVDGAKNRVADLGTNLTHKDLKSIKGLSSKSYRIAANGRIVETQGELIGMLN